MRCVQCRLEGNAGLSISRLKIESRALRHATCDLRLAACVACWVRYYQAIYPQQVGSLLSLVASLPAFEARREGGGDINADNKLSLACCLPQDGPKPVQIKVKHLCVDVSITHFSKLRGTTVARSLVQTGGLVTPPNAVRLNILQDDRAYIGPRGARVVREPNTMYIHEFWE